jgi:hypothetical protein
MEGNNVTGDVFALRSPNTIVSQENGANTVVIRVRVTPAFKSTVLVGDGIGTGNYISHFFVTVAKYLRETV